MLRALNVVHFSGLAVASCGSPSTPAQPKDVNPLVVSEAYAQKHHPALVPKGLGRAWFVEDHGDIWTVEMFRQGTMGGGIKMAIRKRDGQVLGSELTQ